MLQSIQFHQRGWEHVTSKDAVLQVRVESDVRARAESLCAAEGTTLAEVMRGYLAQMVQTERTNASAMLLSRGTGRASSSAGTDSQRDASSDEARPGAYGSLSAYASAELRPLERGAWQRAAEAKHAPRS